METYATQNIAYHWKTLRRPFHSSSPDVEKRLKEHLAQKNNSPEDPVIKLVYSCLSNPHQQALTFDNDFMDSPEDDYHHFWNESQGTQALTNSQLQDSQDPYDFGTSSQA